MLSLKFSEAEAAGTPLNVEFNDVDQFKAVNDTRGHAAGDELLQTLVKRLLAANRRTDVICRYGGEELVVVLAQTPASDARKVLARMIAAVGATPFAFSYSDTLNVSVSAGVATYARGSPPFASAADLLAAAGHALHLAKNRGCGELGEYSPPPTLNQSYHGHR